MSSPADLPQIARSGRGRCGLGDRAQARPAEEVNMRGDLLHRVLALAVWIAFALGVPGVEIGPAAAARDAHELTVYAVTLKGCVVDQHWIPTTDATVHAFSADGRIVGTAFSDRLGAFMLKVPARSVIKLAVAAPGGDVRKVHSGVVALDVGCLQDPTR
jgi:hypothetical protein